MDVLGRRLLEPVLPGNWPAWPGCGRALGWRHGHPPHPGSSARDQCYWVHPLRGSSVPARLTTPLTRHVAVTVCRVTPTQPSTAQSGMAEAPDHPLGRAGGPHVAVRDAGAAGSSATPL